MNPWVAWLLDLLVKGGMGSVMYVGAWNLFKTLVTP